MTTGAYAIWSYLGSALLFGIVFCVVVSERNAQLVRNGQRCGQTAAGTDIPRMERELLDAPISQWQAEAIEAMGKPATPPPTDPLFHQLEGIIKRIDAMDKRVRTRERQMADLCELVAPRAYPNLTISPSPERNTK